MRHAGDGHPRASDVVLTITFSPNTTIDHFVTTNTSCGASVVAGVPTLTCLTPSLPVGTIVGDSVFLVVNPFYNFRTVVASAGVSAGTADPSLANNSASVTLPVMLTIPTLGSGGLLALIVGLLTVAVVTLRRL